MLAMEKMTKNSAMGGRLDTIKNSAIWKSMLWEAVLREALVYLKPTLRNSKLNIENFSLSIPSLVRNKIVIEKYFFQLGRKLKENTKSKQYTTVCAYVPI